MRKARSSYSSTITLHILLLFVASVMLSGCLDSLKKSGDEEISGQGQPSKKEYDPLGLPEDKSNIPDKYPLPEYVSAEDNEIDSVRILPQHFDDIDSTSNLYSRFRIQLYSSNTYGAATREANIAREVFDQEVFLDYEVPYYKVRVGNFTNRLIAEEYVPAAKQAGYNTAWVVKVALDVNSLDNIYDEDNIPDIDIPDRPGDSTYAEPKISDEFKNNPQN